MTSIANLRLAVRRSEVVEGTPSSKHFERAVPENSDEATSELSNTLIIMEPPAT